MQQNSKRMKQMERLFPKVKVTVNTLEVTEIEESKMKTNDLNQVNQNDETILPNDWSEEDQKMFDEIIKPNEGSTTEKSTIKNSTISGVAGIVAGTATNLLLGRSLLPTTVGVVFGIAGCYGASRFVDETNVKTSVAMFATGFGATMAGAAVVNMFASSVEEADKLIEDNKEFFEEISEPAKVTSETTEVLEMVF